MRHGEKVSLQSSSKISNLDPFIDENEVLHVGGRIKRSNLNTEYMHPILLSGKGIVLKYLSSGIIILLVKRLYLQQNYVIWVLDCESKFSGSVFHC